MRFNQMISKVQKNFLQKAVVRSQMCSFLLLFSFSVLSLQFRSRSAVCAIMETCGGYPVERFVTRPVQDLICGICLDVLKNPHQCKKGHCFCFSCVKKLLSCDNNCPTCRMHLTCPLLSEALFVRNIVGSLTVFCDNKCGWTGPLDRSEAHITADCPKVSLKCGLFDSFECFCHGTLLRGESARHIRKYGKCKWYMSQAENFYGIANEGWDIILDDDSIYKGEVLNGVYHGEGGLKTSDGKIYCGQWSSGVQHGVGALLWEENNVYYGHFANGYRTGRGIHKFGDESEYRGEFVEGKYCGSGCLKLAGESTFTGTFSGSKYHGQGVLTLIRGDIYCGEWFNGAPKGRLTVEYADGSQYFGELTKNLKQNGQQSRLHNAQHQLMYEGDWVDGWRHGSGLWKYPNKDSYDSAWKYDERDGYGVMNCYSNGSRYEGNWSNDLRNGQGVAKYANGDVYNGSWVEDNRCGQGVMFYANGDEFEGMWENNDYSGEGCMKYENGDVYTGDWSNDLKNGKGVMHCYDSGRKYTGDFVNDEMSGKGEMKYRNGDIFKGSFLQNASHGEGVIITHNLTVYSGVWHHGYLTGHFTCKLENGDTFYGKQVADSHIDQGRIEYANGDIYTGFVKNMKRHGEGVMVYKHNGVKNHREWRNDVCDGPPLGLCCASPPSSVLSVYIVNDDNGTVGFGEDCSPRHKRQKIEGST